MTYADANFNASTLAAGNITLNKTGTANGTLSVSGSGLTRTVTIGSITGNGSLGISIAAGTASDLAGNLAAAAGPSATFTVDNTAPTISIGGPSASYTAGGPITYTVTYADANFNSSTLAAGNITLNKTGTANGTVSVSGSGLTRTVTISSITGNGSLGISIAAGTASDLAGNLAPAAGPSATFTVDNTAPTSRSAALRHLHDRRAHHLHGDLRRRELQCQHPGRGEHYPEQDRDRQRHAQRLRFGPDPHGHHRQHHGRWFPGDFHRGRDRLGPGRQPGPGRRAQRHFHGGQHRPHGGCTSQCRANPVTSATTVLSVLGADLATGEGSLTYSWTATSYPDGATPPTFSPNGSNAAKNTTVTFSQWGDYSFQVTITDPDNRTTTSSVNDVTVSQTLASFSITALPFVATAVDQFGNPLPIQPPSPWSLGGAGIAFDAASGATVNLDGASPVFAAVTFDSTGSYALGQQGPGGTLHLANGASPAMLTVTAGSHTIAAPLAGWTATSWLRPRRTAV